MGIMLRAGLLLMLGASSALAQTPIPLAVAGKTARGNIDLPGGFRLSGASPNPFSGRAQFTLEVAAPQAVRVGLYDALGRRVALLYDGEIAAGAAHPFTVDAHGLAGGTYFIRATGEAIARHLGELVRAFPRSDPSSIEQLRAARHDRFRRIGAWSEAQPAANGLDVAPLPPR